MKVKDFLWSKYQLDVNDSSSKQANDVKNRLKDDGFKYVEIFEKELFQLENNEIYSLFASRYIQPGGRPLCYIDVVERGLEEMKDYK